MVVRAGKLATLKGTVTRMSHVRPLITEMDFICNKCGTPVPTALPDGRFTAPTRCAGVLWSAFTL
jgi:DNA helicase MCM8